MAKAILTTRDTDCGMIDPALIVAGRMEAAGEDDGAYEAAREAFIDIIPLSAAGYHAKVAFLQSYFNGDTLLPAGLREVKRLCKSLARSTKVHNAFAVA